MAIPAIPIGPPRPAPLAYGPATTCLGGSRPILTSGTTRGIIKNKTKTVSSGRMLVVTVAGISTMGRIWKPDECYWK